MSSILIVEDDPRRLPLFYEVFAAHDITWVTNAADAVRALEGAQFDAVMLDHDLAAEHYKDLEAAVAGTGTGQEAAHAVVEHCSDAVCIVHSWNPAGAQRIGRILTEGNVVNTVASFGSPQFRKAADYFNEYYLTAEE